MIDYFNFKYRWSVSTALNVIYIYISLTEMKLQEVGIVAMLHGQGHSTPSVDL